MSDLSRYSVDDLRRMLAETERQQNASAMSHRVSGSAGSIDPNAWAAEEMPVNAQMRAGLVGGAARGGRHLANFLGLYGDDALRNRNAEDAALQRAAPMSNLIGEGLTLAAPVGAPARTASAILRESGPLLRGVNMGRTARVAEFAGGAAPRQVVEGSLQGAIMAEPGKRGEGAAFGAAGGAALPLGAAAIKKVSAGLSRTPEADRLIRQGVDLTPGQLRPRGFINQIEESSQSVPLAGGFVRSAREDAREQWAQQAVASAAAPGARINAAGGPISKWFDEADDSFGPAYDQFKGYPVLPVIMPSSGAANIPLTQAFSRVVRATPGVSNGARKTAQNFLDDQLNSLPKSGRLDSEDLLRLRSKVREEIRTLDGQTGVGALDRKKIYENAEKQISDALFSQLPPGSRAALAETDIRYKTLLIVRDALQTSKGNAFTPSQLLAAIRRNTDSKEFARGGGFLRQLADDGRAAFEVQAPATGARVATLAPLGLGAAADPSVGLPLLLGGALATLTGTGRRLARGQSAPQRALSEVLLQAQAAAGKIPQSQRLLWGEWAKRTATGLPGGLLLDP